MRELTEARQPGATRAEAAIGAVPPRSRTSRARRLGTFVAERFPPLAYGPLIAALVACGTAAAAIATGARPALGPWLVALALAVTAAFLQLRILDEIRDAEVDREGRPERPVPRGLVSITELRAFAILVGLAGAVLALPLGAAAFVCYSVAAAAIWLLGSARTGRLTGRSTGRRPQLRAALTHSVIAPLLLLCAWASVAGIRPLPALGAALLLVWGASLGMEVSRKTVRPIEEHAGVPTYSAELGRQPALLLAALALGVALAGAGGLALAVGAVPAVVIVPLVGAALVPVIAARLGPRVGTGAVRATGATLVLVCLVWPLVVMAGLP